MLAPDLRDDEMAEERLAAAKSILLLDHPEDHRCEFYGVVVFRSGDTFLAMIWIYDASPTSSRASAAATSTPSWTCSWRRAGTCCTGSGWGAGSR